ncbi:DUF6379 domain-containing protein [Actinoplanes sp. NPDC051851]|uniref:C-glycoside deglycosidase beta subunit domain-containing protein n=1 Tax=Actinoplanes sp. NPDC051851 TaxID=3154753 RepID=UPI00342BE3E1
MGLSDGVVRPGALRRTVNGLDLDVRVGWYRSLPLSSVRVFALEVDGAAVTPTFELDGATYTLDELPAFHDKWWFVQDPATLHLPVSTAKSAVRVELEIGWRIPYIVIGPETALVQRAHVDMELEVAA